MRKVSGKKAGKPALEFFQRGFLNLRGTDETQTAGSNPRTGRKKKIVRAASVLACIVAFTTTYALILPAVTLERQPVCGQEEHIHTDACYAYLDATGATVDPAEAAALLAAGDPGSDTESSEMTLSSGSWGEYSEGIESNVKTETGAEDPAMATVDSVTGTTVQPESDTAQSVRRVLICGQEEHQHSVECYPSKSESSSSDSAGKASPKSALTGLVGYDHSQSVTVDGTTITAEYNDGVLPEDVTMQAVPVSADAYVGAVADAVGKENTEIRTFDITFLSNDQEIEPSGEVKITFQADFIDPDTDPAIVHITDDGSADRMDAKISDDTITLKTDSFSVYAISYTVDFHWEVDGKEYEYRLTGGDSVSLRGLVEILHIIETDKVEHFLADIEDVEFSDPGLVWTGKVESLMTASQIADSYGLVIEYSDELSEEEKEEFRSKTYDAGEWVLLSEKAFRTKEILTVTMKTGERLLLTVTDAYSTKVSITDYQQLDGKTFALVGYNNSIMTSTQQGNNLQAKSVAFGVMGNDNTVWKFQRISNTNRFYISKADSNPTEYLTFNNLSGNSGTLYAGSSTPQELTVTLTDGRIRITDSSDRYAVNLFGWKTENGFGAYTKGNSVGGNEALTLYEIDTNALTATFSGTHQNTGNSSSSNASYYGSEDRVVPVYKNGSNKYVVTLPSDIAVPSKYKAPDGTSNGWKLGGWYVVTDDSAAARYYTPGTEVEITKDTIFYADWVPVSYDYGKGASEIGSPLGSDNNGGDYIPDLTGKVTTEVYDFSSLFNVNAGSQVERDGSTWKIGDNAKDYVFFDDNSNYIGSFDNPSGREGRNSWTGGSAVTSGAYGNTLWNEQNLTGTLFNQNSDKLGVKYVGTGSGLFYTSDSLNEYYEYDSQNHAASYNESEHKFYVFTQPQYTKRDNSESTAFLPFNGEKRDYGKLGGEINYWFGIKTTVNFELPDNKKTNRGQDIIFEFSGDDDVWVVIDGQKVYLDLGGIHSRSTGTINFTQNIVTINGKSYTFNELRLPDVSAGKNHKLEFYYLERGASDSNCKIKFNLPLVQKTGKIEFDKINSETKALLDGAGFTLYKDKACTQAYKTLSATNGHIADTGIPVGTYYMKETTTPTGYRENPHFYRVVVDVNYTAIYEEDEYQTRIYEISTDENGVQTETLLTDKKIENEPLKTGSIAFTKTDLDGVPLQNASFTLYKDVACKTEYKITDVTQTASSENDGEVKFENLPTGNYYMKETAAPAGYARSDAVYLVHIDETEGQSYIARVENGVATTISAPVKIINEPVRVTVKKVDQNGVAMRGAKFTLSSTSPSNDITLPNDGEDTGVYVFTPLPDGVYTLKETAPEGFTAVSDIAFKVENGAVVLDGNLPSGVVWDGGFVFTVTNRVDTPGSGELKVVKQWLDQNGEPIEEDKDVTVQLKRRKMDGQPGHWVTVDIFCTEFETGTGLFNRTARLSKTISGYVSGSSATVRWDQGEASVRGNYHDNKANENLPIVNNFSSAVVEAHNAKDQYKVTEEHSNGSATWTEDKYYDYGYATLNISGIVENVYIQVYTGDGIFGNSNDLYNYIKNSTYVATVSDDDPGSSNTGTGEYIGDTVFNNENHTLSLKASDNYIGSWTGLDISDANGPYQYYIEEVSVEGYDTEIQPADGVFLTDTSGATISVYNKSNKSAIDITILKKDEANTSKLLGGAEFKLTRVKAINSTDQVTEGRYEKTGTTSDDATTKGQLKFTDLAPGYYYLEETKPPTGYVKTESGWHFQVNADGIVQNAGDAANTTGKFRYENVSSIIVTNASGASLPSTGGSGTTLFTVLGSILVMLSGVGLILWRRRRFMSAR